MNMIIHNLKVALRNLMKYKLQTFISVLSIAIGIVTLAFVYSIMKNAQLPAIYGLPYSDRIYELSFRTPDADFHTSVNIDIMRALKQNGGLKCIDKIALPTGGRAVMSTLFILPDSTQRKGTVRGEFIDPEYLEFIEFRSALDGKRISELKPGQAIIGERLADKVFGKNNPKGALQVMTGAVQPIPVTIVDVYRHMPSFGKSASEDALLFCIADHVENQDPGLLYLNNQVYVVLKKGYDERQLFEEVDDRIRPLNLETTVTKAVDKDEIRSLIIAKTLAYTIGALILLAAMIGFMRIQSQLFMIRQRELTLRIVNGASIRSLFGMLFTETAITISVAMIVAVVFGIILQEFISARLDILFQNTYIQFRDIWPYCLSLGGGLLILCGILTLIGLLRLRRDRNGLAVNLHRNHRHVFRNLMLSLQIAICMLFVSTTFLILWCGDIVMKNNNIPKDDSLYDDCLLLRTLTAVNPEELLHELSLLTELDRLMMCDVQYYGYEEIISKQETMEKLRLKGFKTFCTTDTALIGFLGLDVDWLDPHVHNKESMIIGEDMYRQLDELGILENSVLHMYYKGAPALTVAGKFKNMPYDRTNETIIAISDQWHTRYGDYVLVPKKGKAKELAGRVKETIDRIEYENIQKESLISNFRNNMSLLPVTIGTSRIAIGILAFISLLICTMGIFSTITLETRSRLKEVAIRKVNGAKGTDIYRMFGKAYAMVICAALIIVVPVFMSLTQVVKTILKDVMPENIHVSLIIPLLLGCLLVIVLICGIVGMQIRHVMMEDPAKIIAKE